MKTVILGAGSLGCVFGGFLAEAGYDVTLIGRRRSHTDAIVKEGLIITGIRGTHVVKVKATSDPLEVEDADLLILLTKTVDTVTALDSVPHLYQRVQCAVSLQNGLVKDDRLRERFGQDKVIGGTTMTGGTLLGDGRVEYTTDGITSFGEFDGSRTERVENIVSMFHKAGLKAEVVDDIRSVEWTKLVLAVPGMAVSSLARLEFHKVLKNKLLASLYAQLVKESAEVALKDGAVIERYPDLEFIKGIIDADFDHAVELLIENGVRLEKAGMTNIIPSMLQSILKGKKTEVEETIGYVAKKAKELGVNAQAVEFCYKVIKGIDGYLE